MIKLSRLPKGTPVSGVEVLEFGTVKEAQKAAFGFVHKRIRCTSCELSSINGVVCHERGCPDAWRDSTRSCKECGSLFTPTERHQEHCDDDCRRTYYGQ